MFDFMYLSATGVAEIDKSTNLKGWPHTFVHIVFHIHDTKVTLQADMILRE